MTGRFRARRRQLRDAAALLVATLLPLGATALSLDWGSPAWPTPTTTSQVYVVDGENVTVTITDTNDVIDHGTGPLSSPASLSSSSFLDPPSNAGALNLFVKTDANTSAPWVDITLDFAHVGGVTDVVFEIFDVDRRSFFGFGYIDELEITAGDGTSSFDPASVVALTGAPSWTFDGTHTITGTSAAGETSENGTARVTFDDVLDTIRIRYKNTLATGGTQWMGLSTIRFRRTPEPSTVVLLGVGLFGLAAAQRLSAPR